MYLGYILFRTKLLRETGPYVLSENGFPQLITVENYVYYKDCLHGMKTVLSLAHFKFTSSWKIAGLKEAWKNKVVDAASILEVVRYCNHPLFLYLKGKVGFQLNKYLFN